MNPTARRFRSLSPAKAVPASGHWLLSVLCCSLFFQTTAALAQLSPIAPPVTSSVSGQFVVSAPAQFSWLFNRPEIAANTNLIRLDPALLAVAVERFKVLLWQQVGLKAGSPWQGKVQLVLRAAHSPEDEVTIASSFMGGGWSYQVLVPDVLTRARYARALSAVLLLEIANRDNRSPTHCPEIPAWLVDGLGQQVLDEDAPKLILSLPAGIPNGAPMSSVNERERGPDALASARTILQNSATLTFDQLSWPTEEQLNGDDGGVYRASAQLFVHELLRLPAGPEKIRFLLARLPGCLNWQLAFYDAYRSDFKRPVDVEKWWSLRAIEFAAHNANSQLTAADSDERLAELLEVPVQIRGNSNSLPWHTEISLQKAIRELEPAHRDAELSSLLRDLELAQYRLARPYAVLAAGYRDVLRNFLGESEGPRSVTDNRREAASKRAPLKETLKRLDALDLRRRELAARLNFNFVPRTSQSTLKNGST
jgi:hypothetical protein